MKWIELSWGGWIKAICKASSFDSIFSCRFSLKCSIIDPIPRKSSTFSLINDELQHFYFIYDVLSDDSIFTVYFTFVIFLAFAHPINETIENYTSHFLQYPRMNHEMKYFYSVGSNCLSYLSQKSYNYFKAQIISALLSRAICTVGSVMNLSILSEMIAILTAKILP